MKLRSLVAAMLSVSALLALAGTASATTLEIKGVVQNAAVSIHATLESGSSFLETTTVGEAINTCTESTISGTTTTPFTATRVGLPVASLSFGRCTEGPPTIHSKGYLEIEWISGTTNGTVFWKNLKLTTPSVFGSLTCTTPSTGTDVGKLTGVTTGRATLHFHAVLSCGFLTATWAGSYAVTSPEDLGVTS